MLGRLNLFNSPPRPFALEMIYSGDSCARARASEKDTAKIYAVEYFRADRSLPGWNTQRGRAINVPNTVIYRVIPCARQACYTVTED